MELPRTSEVFCLGFGNDHRHRCLTLDVLLTIGLFMLSISKPTDYRSSLSIGRVTFLHIPSSSRSSSPAPQQPRQIQHHRQPTSTVSQEHSTPLSSHCREAISYLASIHSPSHAFQRALSLPNQGLNSHSVWGFNASSDGLTQGALPKRSEHSPSVPLLMVLLCPWTMSSLLLSSNHL